MSGGHCVPGLCPSTTSRGRRRLPGAQLRKANRKEDNGMNLWVTQKRVLGKAGPRWDTKTVRVRTQSGSGLVWEGLPVIPAGFGHPKKGTCSPDPGLGGVEGPALPS